MFQNILRVIFFIVVVKPLLSGVIGLNVVGREQLSKLADKQFILVANHNSHLDALALMNLFPLTRFHEIHPVAAEDYFMKSPFLSWFSTVLLNIIPIPRDGITKTNNPIQKMGTFLEQGHSLILFPEGTRGEPEQMEPFKTGIAHLIKKYPEIPVVPTYLKSTGRSLPKGEFILVPFFCDLIIGECQYFSGSKAEILTALEDVVCNLKK